MCHSAQLAQDRDRHASKASSLAKENAVLNDALLNATNQIHYLEQRLKSIEAENAMNQKTQEEALKILEQKVLAVFLFVPDYVASFFASLIGRVSLTKQRWATSQHTYFANDAKQYKNL